MSIMLEAAALRVEPNGQRKGVIAHLGDQVDVLGTLEVDALGGGKESWTKIQLLDADGVPEGWVHTSSVDLAGTGLEDSIDIHNFARQCWWERLNSDVNPYYLVAVAELRSKIAGGQEAGSIGPFRFTQAEWNAGRIDAQFGLGTFRERDIADWRMQCVMFGLMAHRAEAALTSALTRQPSWAELYLAQMIGPQAAAAVIKNPNDTVEKAFLNLQDADFPAGGLTRDQLLDRYAKYLCDPGSPNTPVKGQVALDRIAAGLQSALETVSGIIDEVGNEFLGDEPNDSIVDNAKAPIPSPAKVENEALPALPLGDAPPLVPGAGGALGELIAAHESGKAGYGAYNKGNAGDAVKPIDFSQMTIKNIMNHQSLPKGNANRLFAVGKYQLIPVTMKDAVSKLGLNPNDTLTPKLQEKLFRNYLVAIKRPAVKDFITGQRNVSLSTAQMALAFEFASIARPDTGRSNYGGIAGNKASLTAQRTARALVQERRTFLQLLNSGKTPEEAWVALSPGIS